MDIGGIKIIVRDEIRRFADELLVVKKCPKCGKITSMLKVSIEPEEEELSEYITKFRCLNCLALLEEDLKEANS